MKTVEIPVQADDISIPMRNMRQWLDQRQVEWSSFSILGLLGALWYTSDSMSPSTSPHLRGIRRARAVT
jgi:hypothetical protein